jgi:carboxylesterase type B
VIAINNCVEDLKSFNANGICHKPRKISAVMSRAWINFTCGGYLSQRGLDWPRYNMVTRKEMIFNVAVRWSQTRVRQGRTSLNAARWRE